MPSTIDAPIYKETITKQYIRIEQLQSKDVWTPIETLEIDSSRSNRMWEGPRIYQAKLALEQYYDDFPDAQFRIVKVIETTKVIE